MKFASVISAVARTSILVGMASVIGFFARVASPSGIARLERNGTLRHPVGCKGECHHRCHHDGRSPQRGDPGTGLTSRNYSGPWRFRTSDPYRVKVVLYH